MTTPPTERRCACGHAQKDHAGEGACRHCPSSAVWVDSMAEWVFPCERFVAR